MRVTMQHAQHLTLEQMREFVAASGSLSFTGADREEIYGFVEGTRQPRQPQGWGVSELPHPFALGL